MLSRLFGGGGNAIDVTEAQRRAAAGEVVLVDVREADEWKAGHAAEARHVPLSAVAGRLPTLSAGGRPVAFICRSGARSGKACATARQAGIAAMNVKGGMHAWQLAGLPVVR